VKVTRGSGAAVIDGRGQAKLVPAHTNPAHTRTQPPDTSSTIALTALTPRQSPSLAPAWLFVATVMTRKKNDTGHRVQAHRYLMSCFCGICQCHSGHVLPDRTPPCGFIQPTHQSSRLSRDTRARSLRILQKASGRSGGV